MPDFDSLIELYGHTKKIDSIIGPLYGKMKINNDEKLYHKVVYTYDKLKSLLLKSGFNQVERYNWRDTEHSNIDDHSQAYYPHMDKENGIAVSLNIEGYNGI